jgi:hypothetical protein
MLIRRTELDRIVDGTVDLAFRPWTAARLREGTRLRTQVGLVEVTSVAETTVEAITAADARRAGSASLEELVAFLRTHPDRRVFRIGLRFAGPDPRLALREQADLDDDERARLAARLARFDGASRHGPWTAAVLELIDRRPGIRAADLARELGNASRRPPPAPSETGERKPIPALFQSDIRTAPTYVYPGKGSGRRTFRLNDSSGPRRGRERQYDDSDSQ